MVAAGKSAFFTAEIKSTNGSRVDELDLQRRAAEDSQLSLEARSAGEFVDQMSGIRPTRVLQGCRGKPVRHSRLELSHAHDRDVAAEVDVRQCHLVRHRGTRSP